jgi:hypothetical protein
MSRVPSVNPERDRILAHYRERLAYFERIPQHRREAEHADDAVHDLTMLIAELENPKKPSTP